MSRKLPLACSLLLLAWCLLAPAASCHSLRHGGSHRRRHLQRAISKRSNPGSHGRCGTPAPEKAELAQFDHQVKVLTRQEVLAAAAPPPFAATIPVVFHIIHDGENGKVQAEVLEQQILVINQAFNATGFSFELLNITYSDNSTWFNFNGSVDYSDTELQMKQELRVGGSDTLNVWVLSISDFLGKAEFPYLTMTNPNSPWLVWDGILLNRDALPDGPLPLYNVGHTLTHEVGHWLSLLHTFEGGCGQGNRGDYVSDTPAEKAANQNTCDVARDSCPGLRFPGKDPILNFMDYSPDQCYKNFTPMQINRMQKAWRLLRTTFG